jgi:hypothetical protein
VIGAGGMQDAGLGAAMTRLIAYLLHDQENNDCINIRDGDREWKRTGIIKMESLKMKPDYLEREFRPREPQSRGNKVGTSLDESGKVRTSPAALRE